MPDPTPYIFAVGTLGSALVLLSVTRPRRHLPMQVFLAVWVGVFLSHFLVIASGVLPLYPASLGVAAIVVAAVALLLLGYLGGRFILNDPGSPDSREVRAKGVWEHRADWGIALASILVLIWMARVAADIVGFVPAAQALKLLRSNLNYEGAEWGLVQYGASAVYVGSIFLITKNRGRPFRATLPGYVTFAVALTVGILTTQRTALFMLLLAFFFNDAKRRRPGLKGAVVAGSGFVALFIGVGLVLGKAGSLGAGPADNVVAAAQSVGRYALAPLSALDHTLAVNQPHTGGAYTLRFPIAVLQALGLYRGEVFVLVQDFVSVPMPTNVYTFVHAPWRDFGYGAVSYFLTIGALWGLIFGLPSHLPATRTLQGFAYYPLVVSFFQDQFLTIASQWIQITVLASVYGLAYHLIVTRMDRRRRHSVVKDVEVAPA